MFLKYEKLPCSSVEEFEHKGFSSHAAIVYKDDLYIFCGQTSNKYILSCVFQYSFKNQKWRNLELDLRSYRPPPIRCHTCVLYQDSVYLFAGDNIRGPSNEIYCFDLIKMKWKFVTIQGEKPLERYGHAACMYNHKMFIFGGYHKNNHQLNDTWYFDTKNNKWNEIVLDYSPCKRRYSSLVGYNDSLFLFCGHDGSERLNDFWEFNCTQERWTKVTTSHEMPSLRSSCSAVVYGDSYFIFGGMDGEKQNDLWELDLITKKWKKIEIYHKNTIPPPRYWHVGAIYEGEMYIQGGWIQQDQYECFDDFYKIPLIKKKHNLQKNVFNNLKTFQFSDCLFEWKIN